MAIRDDSRVMHLGIIIIRNDISGVRGDIASTRTDTHNGFLTMRSDIRDIRGDVQMVMHETSAVRDIMQVTMSNVQLVQVRLICQHLPVAGSFHYHQTTQDDHARAIAASLDSLDAVRIEVRKAQVRVPDIERNEAVS